MRLRDARWLTDENIDPVVVLWLRGQEVEMTRAVDVLPQGSSDGAVLAAAMARSAVVLTHDADFGELVVRQRLPHAGIVRLRPGHLPADPVIAMLREVLAVDVDSTAGLVVVAERRADHVHLRVRVVVKQ